MSEPYGAQGSLKKLYGQALWSVGLLEGAPWSPGLIEEALWSLGLLEGVLWSVGLPEGALWSPRLVEEAIWTPPNSPRGVPWAAGRDKRDPIHDKTCFV